MRRLTDRPFAVNHTARPLDEEAFALSLEAEPKVVLLRWAIPANRSGGSRMSVVAAGGIADECGLTAALVLGARVINIGTRFLALAEAEIDDEWKRRIFAAESEDAVKVEFAEHAFRAPNVEGGYGTLPRVVRTPFVGEWNRRQDEAAREGERLGAEVIAALRDGRGHELTPFTGQTAGIIHEVLPAGEIVHGLVAEAKEASRTATSLSR